MKKIFLLLLMLAFLPLVNASLTCTTYSISATSNYGIIPTSQNISCTNSDVNNSIVMTQLGSFFSTNPSQVIIGAGEANKQVQIVFSLQNVGTYIGYLANISTPITITQTVNQQQQQTGCDIDIFPLALSNIKLKNGEKKVRNVQLSVPQCYPTYVNVQGISLQSDERPIQLSEISMGKINPGNNIIIPLELDATESISTGTYSDVLSFLLYNSTGGKINVQSVSISVIVTTGISPISNFTFTDLPVCSLDANEINLNTSHKMTCTITNPNFWVSPRIDSDYIRGISVSETSNQYIYEYQAIKIGNTNIGADFLYKTSKIGLPFSQNVRISASGNSPISGTKMDFNFYQSGSKKLKEDLIIGSVTVLAIDNSSQSLVPSFTLYLNGNQTQNTFEVASGNTYELRAVASGYLDAVTEISAKQIPITMTLEPSREIYEKGEKINVTTVPEGASILLDNSIVGNLVTLSNEGTFVLKSVKQGYVETSKNITVKESIRPLEMDPPDLEKWTIGKTILIKISKSADWKVYRDGVQTTQGTGDLVKFKIDKIGRYEVFANDDIVASKGIEKKSFFSFMPDWWTIWHTIVIVVILSVLVLVIIRLGKKEEEGGVSMSSTPKFGS